MDGGGGGGGGYETNFDLLASMFQTLSLCVVN